MIAAGQSGQRVRDLYLVAVKLVDVAARAGFILIATYGLPLAEAGRFGLIATLVGLFAFAFNFERHIDIQRRTAGQPQPVVDRFVTQALKFFAFNWAIMVPLFVLAAVLWTQPGWGILLLAVVVVIGEHLSNQAYHCALVSHRYYPMLVVVAAKNSLLAAAVLFSALFARDGFDLRFVMEIWALAAVLCTIALGILFWRLRAPSPKTEPFHFGTDILGQHRASLTHFLIGLMAILMLQFDRLVVGGMMSLAETGLYFRHTLLVSFAYQAFNIASFNRILPAIFAEARTQDLPHLRGRVMREYLKTLIGVPLLFVLAVGVDQLTQGVWSERFHLSLWLMGFLLVGVILRAGADFHALVHNARFREDRVLRWQTVTFVLGGVALLGLTWRFGVYGAAAATVLASGLYFLLLFRSVGQLPGVATDGPPPHPDPNGPL